MGVVEAPPAGTHAMGVEADRVRDLVRRRRTPELHEHRVRRVAQPEVGVVDRSLSYTARTLNDVSTASWRPGTQRLIRNTPPPT